MQAFILDDVISHKNQSSEREVPNILPVIPIHAMEISQPNITTG